MFFYGPRCNTAEPLLDNIQLTEKWWRMVIVIAVHHHCNFEYVKKQLAGIQCNSQNDKASSKYQVTSSTFQSSS